MSDIKIFRLDHGHVCEISGHSVAVEKSLQVLIEKHLDTFLGIRFLASEHSTGKKHGGRIDTLGIDENGCPVIIEYKRAVNENVINQGLYYLDWLMDHKADFTLLVMERLGRTTADEIEWSSPRLICIAGDFNKYDEYAVQQINRNIELIRYRRYGEELLLLELVNSVQAQESPSSEITTSGTTKATYKSQQEYYAQASERLRDLFEALSSFLSALGDDVQIKWLKYYVAFRRLRNFVTVKIHPQIETLILWVPLDPDTIQLETGFIRDVRAIGHHGVGDLEITLKNVEDFERAKPLLLQAYEAS